MRALFALAPDEREAGRDTIYLNDLSVIVPVYAQPEMLRLQVETWERYSDRARAMIDFIVVDDGSPEPMQVPEWVNLYRIHKDIPWHREGARNLGAHVAETRWIVHIDVDHLLPPASADALLDTEVDSRCWYRFPRWRIGRADETRQKDAIPKDAETGPVKPHIDSYLCTRELYWDAGGYDEDYAGILGGGSPFLKLLEEQGPVKVLPDDVCLHVYTRDKVKDSSVSGLSRDRSAYKALSREKGKVKGVNPLRFEWSQVQ